MPEINTIVPKFGSFKPRPLPQDSSQVEDRKGTQEKPRDREDRQKHERRYRQHRPRSRDRGYDRTVLSRRSSSPERESTQDIFIIDRKGDLKNLAYGSIHRYDVPPFHRFGAGRVLGTPSHTKIDRDYGEDRGLLLNDSRDLRRRTREKYIFSQVEKERPRLLKTRGEVIIGEPVASEVAYIPLQPVRGKKRKRNDLHDQDASGSDSDNHYRSIHGKVKGSAHQEVGYLQYATESDSSGSDTGRVLEVDAALREESVRLQRQVDQSPYDVETWLALIEHQDKLMRSGNENRRVTNAEIRSTAEIKIHMYEKALEHANSLHDRERLLTGWMNEGSKIWEVKAQADRWEQISQENIESLVLWRSYLNFKQSTFATFRFETVREVYIKRIHLLSEAASKSGQASLYGQLVYALLRFTLFARQSGYTELAVAIWQGLLEFNFRAPLNTPRPGSIDRFKDFWESEVSRIGEDGALGWSRFSEDRHAADIPPVSTDKEDSPLNGRNIFKSWSFAERRRHDASRMPARTLDEVKEDDPFRVILFSDIEVFLVFFPVDSNELRKLFLDAFLLFCGLPPVAAVDQQRLQDLLGDSYIHDSLLEMHYLTIENEWLDVRRDEEGTVSSNIFRISPLNIPASSESLFASKHWFQHLRPWRNIYDQDGGPVTYEFVRNCLQQLTTVYFQEDFAELYLAFEWQNEPDTIKKTTKALLKQHPSSLRLYNAYAMIEWSRDNQDLAVSIFTAALGLSKSTPRDDPESILLWRSWIWLCVEISGNSRAVQLLLSISDGAPMSSIELSPTVLLKTKQYLTTNRDHLLSIDKPRLAVFYTELLALLTYLTSISPTEPQSTTQGDIMSAIDIITTFSYILTARPSTPSLTLSHELLFLSAARLLHHHTLHGPYRPSLLRHHLTAFLTNFPSNTAFHLLYENNESRLRISNRVRNILLTTILTPANDTLPSRLFAIHHEIRHGTIHSARSAFEHAVTSSASRGNPGLWRYYILWCWGTPQFRSATKEIWLRAIKACPWAMELYVLGMERVAEMEGVEEEELRRTWRVLAEKELRIHVDLEGAFEEMEDREAESERRGRNEGGNGGWNVVD